MTFHSPTAANPRGAAPSTLEVAQLGQTIAAHGFGADQPSLVQVIELAHASGLYPGAVAVLRDPQAPEPLRNRAFAKVSRHWAEIISEIARWCRFQRALDQLIGQRQEHERLRQSDDIAGLWASRTKLDELRLTLARHRTSQRTLA